MRLALTFIAFTAFLVTPAFSRANDKPDELWSSKAHVCAFSELNDPLPSESQPANLELSPSLDVYSCSEHVLLTYRPPDLLGTISQNVSAANHTVLHPVFPTPVHAFWDRENDLLFTAVGASRALDYASTLNFRRRGRNEALLTNDIVDNHAAFAAIEVGATALSIGASYLFHHYNHHRLERWTSIIHASLATSGAIRNYCLETPHSP